MTPPPLPKEPILTTANHIEGYQITNYLGLLMGCSTRNHGLKNGFKMSLERSELDNFATLTEGTQQSAQERLINKAKQKGADAVVGITIDFEYDDAICHAVCYGTAVELAPK